MEHHCIFHHGFLQTLITFSLLMANEIFFVVFGCSIKKLPVVQKSQIQTHMKNLLASAKEQDQIHDLLIKVWMDQVDQLVNFHFVILDLIVNS